MPGNQIKKYRVLIEAFSRRDFSISIAILTAKMEVNDSLANGVSNIAFRLAAECEPLAL
jgi:hypothetical protein